MNRDKMKTQTYNAPLIRGEEDEPAAPAGNMMENLMTSAQFDKKFIEQRKVFLWGAVDERSAKDITNRLLFLEASDPGKEITFYINSPGGVVTHGMVIYDTMQMISSPVSTVCMGMAASMGSILLSGGTKGRRFIFPHGEVMIHQPSGGAQGQASDIHIQAQEILAMREKLNRIMSNHTGQSMEVIARDTDRDNFMSADLAREYGIIDQVLDRRMPVAAAK
jgi:ATP-dependent Clp protease protease subunit